jgi:hypothetical protein
MIKKEFGKTKSDKNVLKVEVIQNYYLWDHHKTEENWFKNKSGGKAPD